MCAETNHVTDYLAEDHARLGALLTTAREGQALNPAGFAAFRAGLLRHIGIEEKLLLPAARRARNGVHLERAHELRVEHAALTSLLVPTPDPALCDELDALLGVHNAKEEGPDGLYAECEALLGPAGSRDLAARAAAFPDVPVAPHYDGPGVYRTAALALAAAQRIRRGSRS